MHILKTKIRANNPKISDFLTIHRNVTDQVNLNEIF